MASPADDRLRRWREVRAQRLAALPWLQTDTSNGTPVRYVKDELIVAADHEHTARALLGHHRGVMSEPAIPGFVRLLVPDSDVPAAARHLRDTIGTPVASPNHIFVSTGEGFEMGGPYGPPVSADAYPLPDGPAGNASLSVAVVDTGVWKDSPLPPNWYKARASDYSDSADDHDDSGHANFITGVILSKTRNASVRIVKVLSDDGLCTELDLANALLGLSAVDVFNLSLGGFTDDDLPPLTLTAALNSLLVNQDRVVVAAAGNEGVSTRPHWPAAYAKSDQPFADQVIAVAAHDGEGICAWSNTGPWVTMAAPGQDVTSTFINHTGFPTGFAQWSGTSFAAPYVVGSIAEAHNRDMAVTDAVEVVKKLASEATFGGYPGLR
jgi:thermitase